MFICNNCGETFSECGTAYNYHPYGMGEAREEYGVCPYCNENDFCEAKKCERCGEYAAKLELGLCEYCYGEVYGEQEDESV